MFQHRWPNIDSDTLKTTKPTKTPKIPNRQKSQKSQKPPKNPDRQKFLRHKKFRPKIPNQQKFPTKKIKNGTLRKTLRLDQPKLFCITNQLP
jgi:hypothetical protein